MRIPHWTVGLERRGAMEVGVHSGAHFQFVSPEGAQVDEAAWNRNWFFSSRAAVTSLNQSAKRSLKQAQPYSSRETSATDCKSFGNADASSTSLWWISMTVVAAGHCSARSTIVMNGCPLLWRLRRRRSMQASSHMRMAPERVLKNRCRSRFLPKRLRMWPTAPHHQSVVV